MTDELLARTTQQTDEQLLAEIEYRGYQNRQEGWKHPSLHKFFNTKEEALKAVREAARSD